MNLLLEEVNEDETSLGVGRRHSSSSSLSSEGEPLDQIVIGDCKTTTKSATFVSLWYFIAFLFSFHRMSAFSEV